jgi:hypothetical protein
VRKVLSGIEACRTVALGGHFQQCQGLARAASFAEWQAELLPTQYFHVVSSMPAPIAGIGFQNKAIVYRLLFKAAAETQRTIAADPKHLGADIGLVAALRTWGQNLHHHPHVHCVVPGAGPSLDGTRWLSCCRPGLLPSRAPALVPLPTAVSESLQVAFEAGALDFFGDLARLREPAAPNRPV